MISPIKTLKNNKYLLVSLVGSIGMLSTMGMSFTPLLFSGGAILIGAGIDDINRREEAFNNSKKELLNEMYNDLGVHS